MKKREIIFYSLALAIALLFAFNFKIFKTKSRTVIADLTFIEKNARGYEEFENKKDGSIMILVPSGSFLMGSDDDELEESPRREVYVSGFYISKYEVTNERYKKFCDETGKNYPKDPEFNGMENYFENYPDYPVVNVSWKDAEDYCMWAGMRLPTEAEWEKAARGSDGRTYPWGENDPSDGRYCNYTFNESDYDYEEDYVYHADDGYEYTSPAGTFEWGISPYGCYDMSGNVWEWCSDWFSVSSYRNGEASDPKGIASGELKTIRGGSYYYTYTAIRTTSRVGSDPQFGFLNTGFRPACDVNP